MSREDKVFFKENVTSRGCNSFKKNWIENSFQYAHLHNVIFHYTNFLHNPPKSLGGVAKTKYLSKKMLRQGAITP
jgi:hypothetical protein